MLETMLVPWWAEWEGEFGARLAWATMWTGDLAAVCARTQTAKLNYQKEGSLVNGQDRLGPK